jgi:microcystin-dependent protein
MPVTFPTSLDTSTFPTGSTLSAETLATYPHSKLHDELGQAILHLETKVGIDSSGDTSSLDYKINHITTVPVGCIFPFAGAAAPLNFLMCDGSLISTTTYAALFTVIGNTYGSGSGTFGLPDLRGRVIAGLDNMNGTTAQNRIAAASSLGQAAGESTHVLTTAELASHAHTHNAHGHSDSGHAHQEVVWNNFAGTGAFLGVAAQANAGPTIGSNYNTSAASAAITNTTSTEQTVGSNTAHNNLQPYMALNYIIRY